MTYPRFSEIARTFAPGWFAAVMGTGVLALTTRSLAQQWPLLALPAAALHWFNSALFVLLAVPWLTRWLTRWLRFPEAARQTLTHPVQANFYPTFSIALLVLAAQWLAFTDQVALVLWWLGVSLHFIFSFAVLFYMFQGEQVTVDHVTPANFIPAVGLVVMPLAGGPLLQYMDGALRGHCAAYRPRILSSAARAWSGRPDGASRRSAANPRRESQRCRGAAADSRQSRRLRRYRVAGRRVARFPRQVSGAPACTATGKTEDSCHQPNGHGCVRHPEK